VSSAPTAVSASQIERRADETRDRRGGLRLDQLDEPAPGALALVRLAQQVGVQRDRVRGLASLASRRSA
jgi:hypothetical protein